MPRQYPAELRRRTCERMLAGEAVKDLVAELGISDHTLYRWRRQAQIDAGERPGAKSYEADPLQAACRRVIELEAELKLVKAASALFTEGGVTSKRKFQVVRGLNNLGYSERVACRAVGLSRSTYYNIKHHQPTDSEIRRIVLADALADIHARSRGTYGMLRVRAALEIEPGLIVNKKLAWKIMRELGIKGLPGPRKGIKNLKNAPTCEDLVQRQFRASAPNELWLTDITEHPTSESKVHCCVVLDLYSRKVVGWAIDRRCDTALVNDALAKAHASRSSTPATVIHSDHGSQGEFKWSSQHLDRGGVGGNDEGTSAGSAALSGTDPVAGSTNDRMATGSGEVLGGDR